MTIIILQLFIIIPIIGFVVTWLIPRTQEKLVSRSVLTTITIHFLLVLSFVVLWFINDNKPINLKEFVLFKAIGFEFFIDFYFDEITAVFSVVGSFLTLLITMYSSDYLHREKGFKRFFNTIQFFYIGYNLIIFSGNLETLFIGWEILGVSSFLLIAFYADRFLPVKNAIKVFSMYRVGDIGIIIAMWLSHHLWHENITFSKLNNFELVHEHLESHTWIGVVISFMLLLSACVKSAQLPFSSWLPRAMEGPTPSTAIFYGSLAVHLGIFLLLRTFHFWEHQLSIRILIAVVGLVTSFVASSIARSQASIKSQIAYSSISQIGVIFIEVSLGLETLALIHFAGNAFLRTYQLLVSPSVVSYLIREKFYAEIPKENTVMQLLPKRLKLYIYVLSVKEWNLDLLMYKLYWTPLRQLGRALTKLSFTFWIVATLPIWLACFYFYPFIALPEYLKNAVPITFSLVSFLLTLRAFGEKKNAYTAWILLIYNHFWIALSIMYNEYFKNSQLLLYLSGVVVSGIIGLILLYLLKKKEGSLNLIKYQGLSKEYELLDIGFLIACLGLSGFPITPTFVGEDLLFTHIHEDQASLAILTALSYVVEGLAIMRIYAKLFMGPSVKKFDDVAYKSS